VRTAAKTVDGVKDATASYKGGTAEIVYDPAKTTPEAIAQAITQKTGFKAHVPKKDK
jgi:copper chaperone CopZ